MTSLDRRGALKVGGLLALALAYACSPLSASRTPEGEPTPVPPRITPTEMEPGGEDVSRVVTAEYGELSPALNQAVLNSFSSDHPELEVPGVDKSVISIKAQTDIGVTLSFALVHVVEPGSDSSTLVESNYWVFDQDGGGATTSYLVRGQSLDFVKLFYAYPQENAVVIGFGNQDYLDTPLLRYRQVESYPPFAGLSSSEAISAIEAMDQAGLEDLAGYVNLTFYPPLLSTTATPTPGGKIEVGGYSKVLSKLVPPEFTTEHVFNPQILEDWNSGKIELKDEDRFTLAGEPYPLGYVGSFEPDYINPIFYHGVILDYELIDNYVVVYEGFEDVNKTRFFVPFSYGALGSEKAIFYVVPEKATIEGSKKKSINHISTTELLSLLHDMLGKTTKSISHFDADGLDPNIVSPASMEETRLQEQIARDLAAFMYQATKNPLNTLSRPAIVNQIPSSVNPGDIPVNHQLIINPN